MSIKNYHKSLYEKLAKDITEGVLPDGFLLPTETYMAAQHNVSRPTIGKVYRALKEDGLVRQVKGSGTFVTKPATATQPIIGLLLPGPLESEIFETINDEIIRLATEKNFVCLWDSQVVSASQGRQQQALMASQSFANKKVNGVIFAPIERVENADAINAEIVSKLQSAGIPVVLADREYLPFPSRSGLDLVSLDNFETTFSLTQHLIDRQCERLYFVYRPHSAYSVNMRITAFREALIANNLEYSSQLVICAHPEDETTISKFDILPGKTGIICANDSTAASLLLNFKNQKIGVPEMVRVASFDNMKYAAHLYSPLTSVQQPARGIAQNLVGLLLERIANPQLPPRQVLLSGELIIRESSENI